MIHIGNKGDPRTYDAIAEDRATLGDPTDGTSAKEDLPHQGLELTPLRGIPFSLS